MSRQSRHKRGDYGICPDTGKLKPLVVSSISSVLDLSINATYSRTEIGNVVPWSYRLALWPLSHVEYRERKEITGSEWTWIVLKWIPASLALTIMVSLPPLNTIHEAN
jgi:hypothetical protein